MVDGSFDIILEYIEVFINYILYIRELYPKQIFKKRKIYNAPIFVSIYPVLNDYILKVLQTIHELKRNKTLHKVEIVIYNSETSNIYENYVFEINNDDNDNQILSQEQQQQCQENDDPYLIKFEEELRKSLLTLENRVKILGKLPKDATFTVHLHTTQSAFVKMSHNPVLQEFPWIQENESDLCPKDKISILPISKINSTGIQLYVEKQ